MSFEVVVLGVGDTFSECHNPTSFLLRTDGFQLAIDCPDMYRRVLKGARDKGVGNLYLSMIDDFVITHIHGDHMNGLEGLGFYKYFSEGKRLRLHASPEVLEVLWNGRLEVAMGSLWNGERDRKMNFEDYFQPCPFSWAGINSVGPFQIELRRTVHHVPTSALKVRLGDRVLGFSADTTFDPDLIHWLSEADFIIHETNLGPAHTPLAALAKLPEAIRKKIGLVHYQDGLDLVPTPMKFLVEGSVIQI